jgi:pilus assembly protein CpaE
MTDQMMQADTVSVVVALDAGVERADVAAVLADTEGIEAVRVVEGFEVAWEVLAEQPTDAVLVVCYSDSEMALWFIREVGRRYPERPVVVLSGASTNGFVRHAFDAGAEDLVMPTRGLPDETQVVGDQLRFALEKAVARRRGTATATTTALASLVCVLGPKGGIGKTLTSANLAVSLARAKRRVVIVDLDLQFGDVGLALGLSPQRTIFDLVKSGGSIDADKIEGYLTRHESGVRVLMAPVRPDQASAVTVEFLRDIYGLLRASNDFVIVDTPPGFSPEVIASIDTSTDVCVVGTLDSLSLKNTKLGLETLELMGYDRERIRLVLNRADTKVGVTHEDVLAVIGRPPDVLVPSHRDIARSINEGSPIVAFRPRSDAAHAFNALAASYIKPAGEPEGRRRGRRRKR